MQAMDDPADDLLDVKSESSEPNSPDAVTISLPGESDEEAVFSDNNSNFEGVMTREESRKRKNKAQSKKNRKKKRMLAAEAGILPKVREKARDKHLNNAGVLLSSVSATTFNVSQNGYIAVNEGKKKNKKDSSPEGKIAEDLIDKGYRLVKWDGR